MHVITGEWCSTPNGEPKCACGKPAEQTIAKLEGSYGNWEVDRSGEQPVCNDCRPKDVINLCHPMVTRMSEKDALEWLMKDWCHEQEIDEMFERHSAENQW